MRKSALVLLMLLLAVATVRAEEPRFKLSLGGLLSSPLDVRVTAIRDGAYDFRSQDGPDAWRDNFRREYMVSHGVNPNDPLLYWPAGSHTYCCGDESDWFSMPPGGVTMKPGDEYLMWSTRTPGTVREHGWPLSASLEYRATGPLWLAFSFQKSRETTITTTEISEVMRVRSITPVSCNCETDDHTVNSTRHRIISNSGYSQEGLAFAILAKVDLTRRDRFWSVMPQAGIDLLLSRDKTITNTQEYEYLTFSKDNRDEVGDNRRASTTETRYHLRPTAGMTVELYPATKSRHVAIVADGRYHFNSKTFEYEHGGSSYVPYWYEAWSVKWTFSLGALVRF